MFQKGDGRRVYDLPPVRHRRALNDGMSIEERIESLGLMFQERYGLVLSVAGRFAPSRDLIEDIVQQVYIDFVYGGSSKNWDLNRDVSALLFKITKEKSLLAWRERCRRRERSIDDVIDSLNDSAFAAHEPEDEWETMAEEIRALESCLELLPPKTRRLVEDHYYRGETITKIGRNESLSLSAAYRFFRKVRSTLKTCIERSLQDKKKNHE